MYEVARRVAGRAQTPYAAVLALESWLRDTGGFRYDETPPNKEVDPIPAEWNALSKVEFDVPPGGTDQANFDILTRKGKK